MAASEHILNVENISKNFGGLQAMYRLSFRVRRGEIFSIIGPNGAGKTTAINLITGAYSPTSGEIYFEDRRLHRRRPHQIARLGIARTFQNVQVFANMTVRENIMVGLHGKSRSGFLKCMLRTPLVITEERRIREKTEKVLEFMDLEAKAELPAGGLPYGDQKRLEIARSLAAEPRLLFLDEPVAGLNMQETQEMARTILKIRGNGITVVLVEHDMNLVMGISDVVTVLNYGQKIAQGCCEAIQNDPDVIEAYLGKEF